jgi:hypothetical protein
MGDTIVAAMMFNVWFPVAMEFGYYGMRLAFKLKDYFGREEGYDTKTNSI